MSDQILLSREKEFHIKPDYTGLYRADGLINGKSLRFLVDTGISTTTLSREHAGMLGIDIPEQAERRLVMTASGLAKVTHLNVAEIQVAPVVGDDALAAVTETEFPEWPLLGLLFLKHLQLTQPGSILELRPP